MRAAQTVQRVGYLSARIDNMTYGMTFDLATRTGLVVVNTSLVNPRHLSACVDKVCSVFEQGYAMGTCLALLPPGDTLGEHERTQRQDWRLHGLLHYAQRRACSSTACPRPHDSAACWNYAMAGQHGSWRSSITTARASIRSRYSFAAA